MFKYSLYHNIETEDGLRSDGAGAKQAVVDGLKMWDEERKAIVLETVLERDGEIYYEGNMLFSEVLPLVNKEGKVTPRVIRDAAKRAAKFIRKTAHVRPVVSADEKIAKVLKNDARLKMEEQLQAVVNCLYQSQEEVK